MVQEAILQELGSGETGDVVMAQIWLMSRFILTDDNIHDTMDVCLEKCSDTLVSVLAVTPF